MALTIVESMDINASIKGFLAVCKDNLIFLYHVNVNYVNNVLYMPHRANLAFFSYNCYD